MIFEASNIYKKFPRSNFELQVPNVSLAESTITGVVGENGNGKTTLLNIIAGELQCNGALNYLGETVSSDTNWSALKQNIAFIPQRIPRWYGSLIQNLKLKASLDGIEGDIIDAYLDEILTFLGLMKYKHLKWTEISTGYRLRFELARVLIGKPSLLVLDEPLANLDINTQQKFLSDLKNILSDKEYTTAVILSSQQLHEIETVSDQMIFLKNGHTVFSGNMQELGKDEGKQVFEFQVSADSKPKFMEFLKTKELHHIQTGEYLQVSVDSTNVANSFLKQVLAEDIDVKYYRNISQSTKRLFNQ